MSTSGDLYRAARLARTFRAVQRHRYTQRATNIVIGRLAARLLSTGPWNGPRSPRVSAPKPKPPPPCPLPMRSPGTRIPCNHADSLLEPTRGFEPRTPSLRVMCSTN
jgi:hypothetical protein